MEFYILINNVKQGPFSLEELAGKNITSKTMVWKVGFTNWLPAYKVEELSELLSKLPPEPPIHNNPPKTWLVESILVTVLCCLPLGIVGIINATKVDTLYYKGEYKEALYYSDQAKKWTTWGFFISLFGGIGYLFIIGIIGLLF